MLRTLSPAGGHEGAVVQLRERLLAQPADGGGFPSITLGRAPQCSVVLGEAGAPLLVSRLHAAIMYDGEQFSVRDLSTTNGTYVSRPTVALRLPSQTH